MCKKIRILFLLLLMIILTACTAREGDLADNALATDLTDEPIEIPTGLPPKMPSVAQTATPRLAPEVEVELPPRSKGDIQERSYDSRQDFPYENMDFVDEATFTFLKKVYGEINFYGEFQMGDLSVYDEYIEMYRKLLNSEIPFIVQDSYILPQIGRSYYMEDYSTIRKSDKYDPNEFVYYLFDMDGDGNPELCIWNYATYIFKYDMQSKEMILWVSMGLPYKCIHGTQMLQWDWEGVQHTLCKLNEKGEVIFGIYFLEESYYSNGKVSFMVTLPFYEDGEMDINMEIKEQAYFSEENGKYFFNVTEEQYNELTKEYFQAREESEEELKKITYTYDELFKED